VGPVSRCHRYFLSLVPPVRLIFYFKYVYRVRFFFFSFARRFTPSRVSFPKTTPGGGLEDDVITLCYIRPDDERQERGKRKNNNVNNIFDRAHPGIVVVDYGLWPMRSSPSTSLRVVDIRWPRALQQRERHGYDANNTRHKTDRHCHYRTSTYVTRTTRDDAFLQIIIERGNRVRSFTR